MGDGRWAMETACCGSQSSPARRRRYKTARPLGIPASESEVILSFSLTRTRARNRARGRSRSRSRSRARFRFVPVPDEPHPAGNEYQTAAATACSGKHPCLPCNVSIPGTRSRTGSRIESQAGSLRLQRVERLGAPTSRGRCGRPSSPSLVTTTKTPRHQGFTKTIAGETPALQTGSAPCNTRAPAGEGTTAGVLAVAPP